MLKRFVYLGILLLGLLVQPPVTTAGDCDAKMPVAVVEFDVMGELGIPDAGAIIAEWMISALGRTRAFDLKERVLLKKVLEEQQLAASGLLDDQAAAEIGKIYGVSGVVSGGVLRWGKTLSVTARLIDTTTGTILRTSDIKVENPDQIPGRMDELARALVIEEESVKPPSAPEPVAASPVATGDVVTGEVPKQAQMGQVWKDETRGHEFVWIEGGCFTMGQSEQEKARVIREEGEALYRKNYADEAPPHKVCVDGFWMGRFEVTNAQFKNFKTDHDSGSYKGLSMNGAALPVVNVSWQQARDYADWLTQQQGGERKFRLPTEAEWEFACRAGTSWERFWGDESDQSCKFANVYDRVAQKSDPCPWQKHDCDDEFVATAPVGNYFPNPFGLYDMLGNVWEWTVDGYSPDAYKSHARSNPLHTEGETKVRRGGSWADSPGSVRCGNRGKRSPDRESNQVGFRLVME
ncbi:formylglycine-generating enzyme family protein [Desulfuromonas acetexigens]|uniref:Formylglycine-generating enzyme family protein n=1 Tax=Trichloromonas acetexigens TaxID=38815 RepID=A0A550J8X3_9BACT|nr:formylglycine-generating enzyme family protein [Desulfuromonas acetexigens]TRO79689.1 formylglycine-generating enzyme family protein [Desulfuromonas acetexigens]